MSIMKSIGNNHRLAAPALMVLFLCANAYAQHYNCTPVLTVQGTDFIITSEYGASEFKNLKQGALIFVANDMYLNITSIDAIVRCDETCAPTTFNVTISFDIIYGNETYSFTNMREGEPASIEEYGSARASLIRAKGTCPLLCEDGTVSGHCSTTKPLFCNNSILENRSSECGCPEFYGAVDESCAPFYCNDGTKYGFCSTNKPFYCEVNGTLSEKSSECGCPPGYEVLNESCTFPKCGDNTRYGACSVNKPLYCNNGTLVNRSSVCGCPIGLQPYKNECRPPTCDGITALGTCSNYRPFYCTQEGVLEKRASACGCPPEQQIKGDECIPRTCADNTPYGACSAEKPKFCFNGTLVTNPIVCGCPEGTNWTGTTCEATGLLTTLPPGQEEKHDNTQLVIAAVAGVALITAAAILFMYMRKKRMEHDVALQWIRSAEGRDRKPKQKPFAELGKEIETQVVHIKKIVEEKKEEFERQTHPAKPAENKTEKPDVLDVEKESEYLEEKYGVGIRAKAREAKQKTKTQPPSPEKKTAGAKPLSFGEAIKKMMGGLGFGKKEEKKKEEATATTAPAREENPVEAPAPEPVKKERSTEEGATDFLKAIKKRGEEELGKLEEAQKTVEEKPAQKEQASEQETPVQQEQPEQEKTTPEPENNKTNGA